MAEMKRSFLAILVIVAIYLAIGAGAYMWIERWTLLDSIYFSAMTITTVGYGDLAPATPIAKIFTMAYAFFGIGILFYAVGFMGRTYMELEERRLAHIFDRALRKKEIKEEEPHDKHLLEELEKDLIHRKKKPQELKKE
ncbi:two pore domain potassium channel family protein [Candidatus Woesearchaeota archaeon]|nr:two pore domain potassium channel family protein [Candidatus Woesearchaeota archaeon]